MQSVLGGFPDETNYADYRDASGLKLPYTMAVVSAEGTRTFRWAQVDVNRTDDDSQFLRLHRHLRRGLLGIKIAFGLPFPRAGAGGGARP
jgi:hypothetical protein